MTEEPDRKRRAGGRAGNKIRAGSAVIDQMPWRIPVNPDRPVEPLDADGVQAIHRGTMRILKDIGIEFLNPEAVTILKQAGCKVEGTNIRMDEDFVTEMLSHAPESFTITPRNPDREVIIGGRHMVFVNVSSPPNSWDLERGKRSGDFETFKDFMRLTQYFNCIHIAGGYPVEPIDIHPSVRHLDCVYEKLTITDKVVHAYSLGAERVEDVMEMARIAEDRTRIAGVSPALRLELERATTGLMATLDVHSRMVGALKEVTEGLVQAMATEISRVQASAAGYDSGGYRARATGPSAVAVNQSA
jgi:trimethylamine--corrinoid protein Co-methyltransferase